ncbi:MAG: hypothetical protein HY515_02950 [Candidatus Aenigmarchaeota archaeon]|nr:hypothetical protein [Candidatus Aenigmarchaeota archaeon]
MVNAIYRAVSVILFVLLLSSDASAASIVADYCIKNKCVETTIDAVASIFKGMEIYVSPSEISAYNCKKSDFLNLTAVSPLLSTNSEILVNGQPICEIKGSLLPKTEMCVFSLDGAGGGSEGYTNVIINVVAKSDAGLFHPKELSKNFGVKVNHMVSDDEKTVIAAAKSAEISLASAYYKIEEYENSGYNMSSVRKILGDSEKKMNDGREALINCKFGEAGSSYKNAKRIADAALREAANEKNEQNNDRISLITGKFFSTATNPIFAIVLILIAAFGYQLYKQKNKKGVKLDL